MACLQNSGILGTIRRKVSLDPAMPSESLSLIVLVVNSEISILRRRERIVAFELLLCRSPTEEWAGGDVAKLVDRDHVVG
jgi:hypothetical protein